MLTGGPGRPCRPVKPLCPFCPLSPASPASPLSPRGPWGPWEQVDNIQIELCLPGEVFLFFKLLFELTLCVIVQIHTGIPLAPAGPGGPAGPCAPWERKTRKKLYNRNKVPEKLMEQCFELTGFKSMTIPMDITFLESLMFSVYFFNLFKLTIHLFFWKRSLKIFIAILLLVVSCIQIQGQKR